MTGFSKRVRHKKHIPVHGHEQVLHSFQGEQGVQEVPVVLCLVHLLVVPDAFLAQELVAPLHLLGDS